jgi:hypothetical protein
MPSMAAIEALAPEECICFGPTGPSCVCPDAERALRAIARGDYELTDDAREWCLTEIDRVEGHSRVDHDGDADRHVANGVLSAWTDYCRDKGLL